MGSMPGGMPGGGMPGMPGGGIMGIMPGGTPGGGTPGGIPGGGTPGGIPGGGTPGGIPGGGCIAATPQDPPRSQWLRLSEIARTSIPILETVTGGGNCLYEMLNYAAKRVCRVARSRAASTATSPKTDAAAAPLSNYLSKVAHF